MKVTTSMTAIVVKIEMSMEEAKALRIIAGKLSGPKIREMVDPSMSHEALDQMSRTNQDFYDKLLNASKKGWG
jgi:hypothetical protein